MMVKIRLMLAAGLLLTIVHAHGDEHSDMSGMDTMETNVTTDPRLQLYKLPNYASLEDHWGMMLAHIVFMILAWLFTLPIGVMFSIARSRYALPVQFLFLVLNGVGVALATIYNVSTPDLYKNNAHHSIGWIATWAMTAQVVMSLLFVYAGRNRKETTSLVERAAFLPATLHGQDHLDHRPYTEYRWSADSGHSTVVGSPRSQSRDFSPSDSSREQHFKPEQERDDEVDEPALPPKHRGRTLRNNVLDKYLTNRIPKMLSTKILKVMTFAYEVIDRTIIILGFFALVSGGVTYAGIFRGNNVFSGLAHFVKGGIFFWYGLLTLGRWAGCFADIGWAWNVKPTRVEVGKWASLPSAEFTESFVIFLYGCTNVFMEHMANYGGAWSAQDFEHVSISVLFFGGGLFGMLAESRRVRRWLNTSVDMMSTRSEVHAQDVRHLPKTYTVSMNPVPALVILLLGIMMSSHHQQSMVSTKVHGQWGSLLCGFSIARGLTYIITYISPPTSIYPARPPTELISSFCLISGGLIFMASAQDIMYYLDKYKVMAMFVFTVAMSLTLFLMGYEIFVISLKGWAIRRESRSVLRS